MGRERNQRTEYSNRKNGISKTATPKTCSATSLTTAPKGPIQLWAGLPAGGLAAVLSEGSSGEYETSARTRRTAKTKTKKPTSSLSRRLGVGVNVRAMMFILAYGLAAEPRRLRGPMLPAPSGAGRNGHATPSHQGRVVPQHPRFGAASTPEPNYYRKKAGHSGGNQARRCCRSSLSPNALATSIYLGVTEQFGRKPSAFLAKCLFPSSDIPITSS